MVTNMFAQNLLAMILLAAMSAGQEPGAQEPKDLKPSAAPTTAEAAGAEFLQARKLVQQGKYDQAIAELQQLSTTQPGLKGLTRELGTAYYAKGDYQQAIAALKKALDEDKDDRETTQLLGLSSYLAGRPAEAIPYLEKVQSWFPRANVDASYILGICYIQSKDYPKARAAFARMFDVPPESAASYVLTARMLLRQEFDPVAEEYALKATTIDPKLPGAHLLLGELYLYKSRVPEAVEQLQKELT